MRISDWSSDLCSSDLRPHPYGVPRSSPYLQPRPWHRARHPDRPCRASDQTRSRRIIYGTGRFFGGDDALDQSRAYHFRDLSDGRPVHDAALFRLSPARSEEHTSELQSLMRISYAVFCLKKKKNIHNTKSESLNRKT